MQETAEGTDISHGGTILFLFVLRDARSATRCGSIQIKLTNEIGPKNSLFVVSCGLKNLYHQIGS